MYKLIAIYKIPNDIDAWEKHYAEVHTPLVKKVPSMKELRLNRITGTPRGASDLHVIAEMVFENKEAVFTDVTMAYGLEHTSGLWHHINLSDVNGDGKIDILAGNHGSNTRLKASRSKPMRMYVNDFDYFNEGGYASVADFADILPTTAPVFIELKPNQAPELQSSHIFYIDIYFANGKTFTLETEEVVGVVVIIEDE